VKVMNRYFAAGIALTWFLAAQAFQELALDFWIPAPTSLADELQTYLLPMDQARALVVGGTILFLLVPYTVITLRYAGNVPVVATIVAGGIERKPLFFGSPADQSSLDNLVSSSGKTVERSRGNWWSRLFKSGNCLRGILLATLV
jgi:hypothetical protein